MAKRSSSGLHGGYIFRHLAPINIRLCVFIGDGFSSFLCLIAEKYGDYRTIMFDFGRMLQTGRAVRIGCPRCRRFRLPAPHQLQPIFGWLRLKVWGVWSSA